MAPMRLQHLLIALILSWPVLGQAQDLKQTYANLPGEVLLDNNRVVVQKFVVPPGKSTGVHTRHGPALMVIIKGGILTSATTHRATLWKDGNVFWADTAAADTDAGSTNTGAEPIEFIWVTLKPVATATKSNDEHPYLAYPNIPGEDLLENDLVVVQRFVMYPGQWEGVHAHRPNMLYIFVKGGQWVSRSYKQARTDSGDSPDGSVGWMPTIDISEGHESGNIGKHPSEVVWVSLKK
jgi:predicted metal-dependent enzyme (double-stranded beta helix superfamily)